MRMSSFSLEMLSDSTSDAIPPSFLMLDASSSSRLSSLQQPSAAPAQEVFQFMLQPLFTLIELLNEQRQIGLQPDQVGVPTDAAEYLEHANSRGLRTLAKAHTCMQCWHTCSCCAETIWQLMQRKFSVTLGEVGDSSTTLRSDWSHVSFEAVEAECVLARQHSGIGEPLQANAALQQFFQCGKRVAFGRFDHPLITLAYADKP
ncbi:hypothetical protein HUJ04_013346 [Dendroctonus ponderosae]|nr:hypothetical protein HUJ04_013346 [Dendroctonus ponderosae]